MCPVFLILLQDVHEGENDAGVDTSSSNIPEKQQTTIDRHDVNTTNNDIAQPMNNDSAQPINTTGSDDEPEANADESPGEFESPSQIPCL
jgi:hypothetical protein